MVCSLSLLLLECLEENIKWIHFPGWINVQKCIICSLHLSLYPGRTFWVRWGSSPKRWRNELELNCCLPMRTYFTSCSFVHLHSPCLPLSFSSAHSVFPTETRTHYHTTCLLQLHLFDVSVILFCLHALSGNLRRFVLSDVIFVSAAATEHHV